LKTPGLTVCENGFQQRPNLYANYQFATHRANCITNDFMAKAERLSAEKLAVELE
jgi:hypothetical protein